jgi:disintegrin and metalloproteinase domain-containing protein 10
VNGIQMSLNSGLVTSVNYGARTNERANQLTFGHEVGHALGTNHDTTSACLPGGSAGNFIMYPRASSGTATNNQRYSICSIASMNTVVAFVAGSSKNCFLSRLKIPNLTNSYVQVYQMNVSKTPENQEIILEI